MEKLESVDRYIILMRLANELEHQLDLGALYYRHREKEQRDRQRYMESRGDQLASLAERLGFPSIAAELRRVCENLAAVEIPLEPNVRYHHTEAFLIVPPAYRERFPVLWRRKMSQAWQWTVAVLPRLRRLRWRISRSLRHIMQAPARRA